MLSPASLNIKRVVGLVAERRDPLQRHVVLAREVVQHGALVGLRMGHVEVVGLRARRRDVLAELRARVGLGLGDAIEVVAHADDLRDALGDPVEAVDDGRREAHRVGLFGDVRDVRVAQQPFGAAIQPHVELVFADQLDDRLDQPRIDRAFLDHRHVRPRVQAAVERRQRQRQLQRLDEHLHPARRAPARHGELHAGVFQRMHRRDRPVGQLLVVGHQRPVDVGEHELDLHAAIIPRCVIVTATTLPQNQQCDGAGTRIKFAGPTGS